MRIFPQTYRTWIVWNRDWRVVAFPLVALLALTGAPQTSPHYRMEVDFGTFTAGCIGLAHQMTVQTNQHNVYAQAMDRWIIADSVLTLWYVAFYRFVAQIVELP